MPKCKHTMNGIMILEPSSRLRSKTVDEAARLMFELDGAIGNLQRQADIAKNDAVTKRRYLKGQQWPDLQHSIKEAKRVCAAVQERKGQLTAPAGKPCRLNGSQNSASEKSCAMNWPITSRPADWTRNRWAKK